MKNLVYCVIFSVILSACAPSATQTAPQIASTSPPEPTATVIPTTPAATSTPSETIYTSCADPALLSQVSSDFQEKTGFSVKEAVDSLYENGIISSTANPTDKPSLFHYEAMYLGYQTISLAYLPDAQESDKMVCTFVALHGVPADEAIDILPLMVGYTYQGTYYELAGLIDAASEDKAIFLSAPETRIDDATTWLDQHMVPGSPFELLIETFYGVRGVEDVSFTDNLSLLLNLLNNGYLERMIAVNSTSLHDIREALNPTMRDPGMMAVFQSVVGKNMLP